MGVSKNRGTPKSSILIGFSIINYKPPILGYHYFWKHPSIQGGDIRIGSIQKSGPYIGSESEQPESMNQFQVQENDASQGFRQSMGFLVLFVWCWTINDINVCVWQVAWEKKPGNMRVFFCCFCNLQFGVNTHVEDNIFDDPKNITEILCLGSLLEFLKKP